VSEAERSGLVLAFDTATEVLAIGLGECRAAANQAGRRSPGSRSPGSDQRILRSLCVEAPRRANAELLPRIAMLLAELGFEPAHISEVAVGLGPGSFTGVRIGVAAAKGLAQGLGVPLYGVGTLDAVALRVWAAAATAPASASAPAVAATAAAVAAVPATAMPAATLPPLASGSVIGVLGDAMRHEVYPALFRVAEDGRSLTRITGYRVADPLAVAREWAVLGEPILAAGNGLAKYAQEFAESLGGLLTIAPHELWAPDGAALLAAFEDARADGTAGLGDPALVLPVYTRLSDAEEAEVARAGAPPDAPTAVPLPAATAAPTAATPPPAAASPPPAMPSPPAAASPSQVGYRPMTPDDIEAVLAIEQAAFSDPWTASMFIDELTAPVRSWLVAVDGSGVIGYAGVAAMPDEAHVMSLAVRADRRGEGIGRALLARLRTEAARLGAKSLTLEVREGNAAAIALYEAEGLSAVGMRKGYYADNGEDAVIMRGPVGHAEHTGHFEHTGYTKHVKDAEHPARTAHVERPAHATGLILAIESSCDETAAAVMRDGRELLSNVIASQVDSHSRFGGVVPEIASRKHTEAIVGVIQEAMYEAGALPFSALDAIAVTQKPGLIGALVVGLSYAKGLSLATGLPLVGINHLEGHIFANVLADPRVTPPLVALVVSGGHTSLVHMPEWGIYKTLGETLDDAAGEAFDKVAKVLGLGYPGGPVLSRLAATGDPTAIDFPRAMLKSGDYAFSLSGLKTAVINHIRHAHASGAEINLPDLAASFQAAVIDVQVAKAARAVEETGAATFCLAGGVAANPELRKALRAAIEPLGVHVSVPPFELCTDNAVMIAAAAHYRYQRGEVLDLSAEASANGSLDTAR